MTDSYRHKGLRMRLMAELEQKGITSSAVLKAIGNVPRHLFIESGFINFAYKDMAFPIAAGQTISQPYTVAFQTQLLNIAKGEKVLEVGTGSGYQAAVLAEMGASLYTIERQYELYRITKPLLESMGYHIRFYFGDGYKGLPLHAPFDSIIVTAGAPIIPPALMAQLKVGGRLVIPLGNDHQIMTLLIRKNQTQFEKHEFGEFRFVPLLENKN